MRQTGSKRDKQLERLATSETGTKRDKQCDNRSQAVTETGNQRRETSKLPR